MTPQPTPSALVDRAAAAGAVVAAGAWIGGLIALGACAAPFVFRLTPAPFSGDAMGAAFARFDALALAFAVVVLGCEVARTWIGRRRARRASERIRRLAAVGMAACAAYVALVATPRIMDLHRSGAQRGIGSEGAELDRVHHVAEALGKVEVVLGLIVIALHVFTVTPIGRGSLRDEDEDEVDAPAPLPPGGR